MLMSENKKPASSRRGFLHQIGLLSGVAFLNVNQLHAFGSESNSASTINILSCNIRVDLPDDEKVGNGWRTRKQSCIHIIRQQKADVIGFQEVLANQFDDLKDGLSDYQGIGFDGPEMDKYKEGYHGIAKNPIFFSKKRFELLTAGGYWLSETPLVAGSISWESARARNAFWVRLRDKKTGKQFRVINLHLDHVKDEAKLKQIKLVLEESAQYQDDLIQIMTGDFNSGPDSKVILEVLNSDWKDSFNTLLPDGKMEGTTHGFKPFDKERAKRAKKIDYIFMKGPVTALNSIIIKDSFNNVFPSDHYFLSATLKI
jgi:endonuclease/exonuclease/phosphatase family metal-dependent hydrolase